ncbi:MAG: hypothetical protein LBM02_08665, partial [Lachnospiraceae bacterium]|nr:hypothetical protein [Lachnospiraceae bacterium]
MKNNNFIKTNILFKGLVFLLLVGLFWIYSISGEGVKVQAANSTISSISQLQDKLNSVTGDENIYLTNDFVTDFLANSQNVTFQYSGNYNITIDGSNLTVPISGALPSLIWDFNNSGTGNITFNKLTFGNPDNSSTENIQIALAGSGEFLFENCNFYKLNSSRSIITGGLKLDIKNCLFSGNASACLFPGNDEEVNVYNSTFIDNTNRAIDCNGANVKLNLCNTLFKNNVSTEG